MIYVKDQLDPSFVRHAVNIQKLVMSEFATVWSELFPLVYCGKVFIPIITRSEMWIIVIPRAIPLFFTYIDAVAVPGSFHNHSL